MAINAGDTTYYQAKRGIVQDGLVLNLDAAVDASYPGNGTTWYDLAGSNSGTLTNGPTFDRDNGGSIVFDGTDDFIDINDDNSLTSVNMLSVSIWFNISSFNAAWNGLLCKGLSDSNEEYIILIRTTGYYIDNGAGSGPYRYVSKALSLNTWYNFTYTHERIDNISTLSAYHNGDIISGATQGPSASPSNNNINVTIGSARNQSFKHSGKIALTQIYNRVLSANEVLQNYNATKGRFE